MNKLSIPYFLLFAISLTSMTALFGAEGEDGNREFLRERLKGSISTALGHNDFGKARELIRNDRQEGRRFLANGDLIDILEYAKCVRDYESGSSRMGTLFVRTIPALVFLGEVLRVEIMGCSDDALLVEETICSMNPRAQGAASILALNFLERGVMQGLQQFYRVKGASQLAHDIVTYYL